MVMVVGFMSARVGSCARIAELRQRQEKTGYGNLDLTKTTFIAQIVLS
jgi:hypothetical protein